MPLSPRTWPMPSCRPMWTPRWSCASSRRAATADQRSRLDAATKRVSSSVGVNNSVNQSRLVALQADLDTQRAKVLRLKGLRDEAQVLQRDVENAQKAYEAVMAHVSQSDM